MKKKDLLLAIALALSGIEANADLYQAGPVSPATGNFPTYYQDRNGLALDLCLPSPGAELDLGMCLLTPADIPNPSQAISFPNNFPGEAFWWAADSSVPIGDGTDDAILVLAMEAAFANEEPIPGDQVVFGRIRFRFVAPADGTYLITHPFGTKEVEAVAGERVFFTDDFGVLCGLDFTCAANGHIGPFLRPSSVEGGAPAPFVTVAGKTYIADPAVASTVTGSPFNTNFFRIDGPAGSNLGGPGVDFVQTNQFTLMGRVHTAPLPSNINIEKSTYSRSADGSITQLDVNVKAVKGLGQPDPQLKLFGSGMPGIALTHNADKPGYYYGQVVLNSNQVPDSVYVSDLLEQSGRVIPVALVDQVSVKQANYDTATHELHIEAESSDKSGSGSGGKPDLFAQGGDGKDLGRLASDGTLTIMLDPAVPPAKVIVRSNRGGKDELAVTAAAAAIPTPSGYVANDDTGVTVNAPINVLANDTDGAGNPIAVPVRVRIVAHPVHGSVVANADNTVSYTQSDVINGHDSFSYYVTDESGGNVSNVAKVSFNISDGNLPPVVTPDSASVGAGATVLIDALANDTDADGDALTITNVINASTNPVGNVSVAGNKVSYSAPVTGGDPQTLTYTVSDGHGHNVSGTVTVTIDLPEVVDITLSEFRTSKSQWRIEGTDLPARAGVVMTISVGGVQLGTATTDAAGAWSYRAISALRAGTVRVVSSRGAEDTSPLSIRR